MTHSDENGVSFIRTPEPRSDHILSDEPERTLVRQDHEWCERLQIQMSEPRMESGNH